METKVCSKCKIEKYVSEFYKDRYACDGLRSRCKLCEYQNKNRDVQAKASKKYANTENGKIKLREAAMRYRENNWDKYIEYQREYQRKYKKETRPDRLDNTMDEYFAYLETLEE